MHCVRTIALLLPFLSATALLQWWQLPQYPSWIFLCFGVYALLCICALRLRFAGVLLCIVIGVSIAFLRVGQTTHVTMEDAVEYYGGQVTLHGYIVSEPDRRPLKTKYTVEVDSLETASGDVLAVSGLVLATDYAQWPPHHYGDEVIFSGLLEKPERIEDFHYDRYLSRFNIYSVIYRANFTTLSTGNGRSLFIFLYALKDRFERQINALYPEPHASFMAGLLTGSRRGIPEHLLADFQTTGLTHIIAISGYNIAIVIAVMTSCLFFLPFHWRFIPSALAIISFTLFVGASPSVVRAAIMGVLGLLAMQSGRRTHTLISVLFAAAVMTAWNPKILWYDVGFQLSFLAVLGLLFLSPLLEPLMRCVPQAFALRESLQMTIAAQLTAVPLIVLLFEQFSLIAPLANILVAPLIPLGMLFGFLGVVVSFFSFPLGLLIAYIGWGALEIIVLIAETLSKIPYALLSVTDVSVSWVIAYYIFLFFVYHLYMKMRGPFFFGGRMKCQEGSGQRSINTCSLPGSGNP